jgi:hypothetical protein
LSFPSTEGTLPVIIIIIMMATRVEGNVMMMTLVEGNDVFADGKILASERVERQASE